MPPHDPTAPNIAATNVNAAIVVIFRMNKMSTKLRLLNFRKHEDNLFEFHDVIVKISGESGSGKSTIFEAIYWCLYGKIQKVGTRSGKATAHGTEVALEMPYAGHDPDIGTTIHVHRLNSKNVNVHIGKLPYTGEEAQGKINDYFGTHDMFLMQSYLRAESVHRLISESPAIKQKLTALLFPDAGKYEAYKTKLTSIRKGDKEKLRQLQVRQASIDSSIKTLESTHPDIMSDLSGDRDIHDESDVRNSLNSLTIEHSNCSKIFMQYELVLGQLAALPEKVDVAPMNIEVSEIKEKLMRVAVEGRSKESKMSYLRGRVEDMAHKMSMLVVSMGTSGDIAEYKRLLNVADELLRISPSLSNLDRRIDEARDAYSTAYNRLLEYEESLDNIDYNRRLEDVLECPSCHAKLRHTDTLVSVGEDEDIHPRTVKHQIARRDVDRLRTHVDSLDKERNDLIRHHSTYSSLIEKEKVRNKDLSLGAIDLMEFKVALRDYILLHEDKMRLQKELDLLEKDTREYISSDEHSRLSRHLEALLKKISTEQGNESQRMRLITSRQMIEDKNRWISDGENHMSNLSQRISSLRESLDQIIKMRERERVRSLYLKHKTELLQVNTHMNATTERIEKSHGLESICASAYQEYVGYKLKEIEYDVSALGKRFFTETMNISLIPGTETSTGTVRPSFDLQVEYEGITYEDVNMMSTGEKKRLSIILMMVLSKYMDGRIMMLDEALTSVSMDIRGVIVNELHKLSIPIFITSHDEIPGEMTAEILLP